MLGALKGTSDGHSYVLFRWSHGGRAVSVVGSFNKWKEAIPLKLTADAFGRGSFFNAQVLLPTGTHRFRFLVDGKEMYDPTIEYSVDEEGKLSNVIEVTAQSEQTILTPKRVEVWVSHAPAAKNDASAVSGPAVAELSKLSSGDDDIVPQGAAVRTAIFSTSGPVMPAQQGGRNARDEASPPTNSDTIFLSNIQPRDRTTSDTASDDHVADDDSRKRAALHNISVKIHRSNLEQEYGLATPPKFDRLEGIAKPAIRRTRSWGDIQHLAGITHPVHDSLGARLHSSMHQVASAEIINQKRQPCAAGTTLLSATQRKEGKLLIAMVGLPARGKTFIARSILRHLLWMGLEAELFDVSSYRRKMAGVQQGQFFHPANPIFQRERAKAAELALDDALEKLRGNLGIAVLDGSNITRRKRRLLCEQVAQSNLHCQVVFIESVCNNQEVLQSLMKETYNRSPDFANLSEEEAVADMSLKIRHFEHEYEPMEPTEGLQYLKLIDLGRQIVTNEFHGYIPGRLMLLLANLHVQPRPIWMSRHGESQFNTQNRIGGDSPLSPLGEQYAAKLTQFIAQLYPSGAELSVWTSTMVRTGQTVDALSKRFEVVKWRSLDEINAGMMDGMTYEEFAETYPDHYEARKNDKLGYRYPRGESYLDVFQRLEPVIFEMLRQKGPLLIVGHQAILRVLYGYLTGKKPGETPTLEMPLHTVIQLTPRAYGCDELWHSPQI